MSAPIIFAVFMGMFVGWHLNNCVAFWGEALHPTKIEAEYIPLDDGEADRPNPALSEQWNLPHRSRLQQSIRITKHCPNGLSAKQVLGYTDIGGKRHAPVFPGTLDQWKDICNG